MGGQHSRVSYTRILVATLAVVALVAAADPAAAQTAVDPSVVPDIYEPCPIAFTGTVPPSPGRSGVGLDS